MTLKKKNNKKNIVLIINATVKGYAFRRCSSMRFIINIFFSFYHAVKSWSAHCFRDLCRVFIEMRFVVDTRGHLNTRVIRVRS
jgi:hypothetical protein